MRLVYAGVRLQGRRRRAGAVDQLRQGRQLAAFPSSLLGAPLSALRAAPAPEPVGRLEGVLEGLQVSAEAVERLSRGFFFIPAGAGACREERVQPSAPALAAAYRTHSAKGSALQHVPHLIRNGCSQPASGPNVTSPAGGTSAFKLRGSDAAAASRARAGQSMLRADDA